MSHLKRTLIQQRVILIGEGAIPYEEMEKLKDDHLNIFLREPNPKNWPPEISHFIQYLPWKEQVKWSIYGILEKHDDALKKFFEKWLISVLKDVRENNFIYDNPSQLIEEITFYMKEYIERFVSLEDNVLTKERRHQTYG